MKKIIIALTVIAAALLLPGCLAPTQSTIREYDAAGNVIKETVTSESIVKTVVEYSRDTAGEFGGKPDGNFGNSRRQIG